MAQDAMDGLIEVTLECGETVPGSDAPEAVPRFDRPTLITKQAAATRFE
jgi:hypothetical protein